MNPVLAPPDDGPAITDGASEVLGMFRGGVLNLAGTVASQAVTFVLTVLMARSLGNTAVGQYSQAFAFLALLELLSLSGFRSGLTRFVAVHRADGDESSLRGTIRLGLSLSALTSAGLAVVLAALAPWLARSVFDDPALVPLLRFVAAALPPVVFAHAALSATQGWKTMRYFAGIGLLAVPLLRLALTAALLLAGTGLTGIMTALLISEVAGAVAAGVALRRLLGPARTKPRYQVRELFSFSMVSWMSSLASMGLLWAGTIMLGIYRPSADVGRYQVTARLVVVAALAMAPVNASFAPRIADLHRRGRMEALGRTYGVATSWILRASLPAFVALVVFHRQLAGVFGKGFGVSAVVVVALVVGKLVDAATGPCGLMLNQSGRVALNMADNVSVLVGSIALNIWLMPRYGMTGAAISWAAALVAVNAARIYQVWRTLGMLPFGPASAKGLLAACPALLAGIAVRAVFPGGAGQLLVGLLAVGGTYLGSLLLLGLPADDRLVLSDVRRAAVHQRRRTPGAGRAAGLRDIAGEG